MALERPSGSTSANSIYSRENLAHYDRVVLDFSSSRIWGCPREVIARHYEVNRPKDATGPHLEIGPGTGAFLKGLSSLSDVTLLDSNRDPLVYSREQLAPLDVNLVQADVRAPLPFKMCSFGTVGINYVLHCLPGDPKETKWDIFREIERVLVPGGVVFGATILGRGISLNPVQRGVMSLYNRKRFFGNTYDSFNGLKRALYVHFYNYFDHDEDMSVQGAVALFRAQKEM